MGELIMKRIACRKLALMAFGMSVLLFAFAGTSFCAEAGKAQVIESIDINTGKAVFTGDGPIEKFRFFKLGDPPRLVVDLHGVKPLFKERKFPAAGGFHQVRVGTYQDRTRFVFDSASAGLPAYTVDGQNDSVVVSWQPNGKESSAITTTSTAKAASSSGVVIEAIDFYAEDGQSLITVDYSGKGDLIKASAQGNIIRFGLKNADISRALRRTLDSSAFPSAVRRVTPYTVLREDKQDVRFAVELKGQVPYTLKQVDNQLIFSVKDGHYAEAAPAPVEALAVPVAMAVPSGALVAKAASDLTGDGTAVAAEERTAARLIREDDAQEVYTGEKIRLVFDDADVRDIFQLIAEVSDLNIIVSDEVKGSITLRLIDVPWDQALDLILEIKGLGMLKKGNVVRILPQSQIREMDEAKFTASRNKEKLEDLVTEVIPVSYTDLKNVEGPSKELLTDRGKITADARNKQLIVTDVPSVIEQIKKLVIILDTPERQVMIEARIVEADSTFNRNLGVNWGLTFIDGNLANGWNTVFDALGFGGNFVIPPGALAAGDAVSGIANQVQFGKIGTDNVIIDLQLSAMESSGQGKIISRPRVTTLNGESAKISQGTMIPYQTVSDNEITTELVEAALSLEVTPVINPDNSIILTIKAANSSPGTTVATGAGAAPSIDTKEAQTKMLVMDGETTVIGGIFVENDDYSENGVPILRSLPFFGHLFKSSQKTQSRSELLIFITPRILQ